MKLYLRLLLALVTLGVSVSGFAFGMERFVENVHYQRVPDAEPIPGNVMEFFSFGCPHCAHLEPAVEQWLQRKPAAVTFTRVPATWNPRFEFFGRIYYTLEALGVADAHMQAMFDYIHKLNKPLRTRDDAAVFAESRGIDQAGFVKAWDSEAVNAKVAAAMPLLARYQVRGVPAFVVNGVYMTSVSMAGSEAELFDVIDFLLSR